MHDIKLQTERIKQSLIEELSNSCSYQSTHGTIAELRKYSGWSDQQVEELCSIVVNNGQVSRIINDDDVWNFYYGLVSKFKDDDLNDCATKSVLELLRYD